MCTQKCIRAVRQQEQRYARSYLGELFRSVQRRHSTDLRPRSPHRAADVAVTAGAQRRPSAIVSSEFFHELGHLLRSANVTSQAMRFCVARFAADRQLVRCRCIARNGSCDDATQPRRKDVCFFFHFLVTIHFCTWSVTSRSHLLAVVAAGNHSVSERTRICGPGAHRSPYAVNTPPIV